MDSQIVGEVLDHRKFALVDHISETMYLALVISTGFGGGFLVGYNVFLIVQMRGVKGASVTVNLLYSNLFIGIGSLALLVAMVVGLVEEHDPILDIMRVLSRTGMVIKLFSLLCSDHCRYTNEKQNAMVITLIWLIGLCAFGAHIDILMNNLSYAFPSMAVYNSRQFALFSLVSCLALIVIFFAILRNIKNKDSFNNGQRTREQRKYCVRWMNNKYLCLFYQTAPLTRRLRRVSFAVGWLLALSCHIALVVKDTCFPDKPENVFFEKEPEEYEYYIFFLNSHSDIWIFSVAHYWYGWNLRNRPKHIDMELNNFVTELTCARIS